MDVDEARRIAEVKLALWNDSMTPNRLANPHATSHDPDDEWVITRIEAHSRAWVVHFASRRWVRTQSLSDTLVGTCPLVVERATGELHVYGSAELDKFDAWLDSRSR